jgi:uncharacterized protein (DUF433 family)
LADQSAHRSVVGSEGISQTAIIAGYPQLGTDDVFACLRYAA